MSWRVEPRKDGWVVTWKGRVLSRIHSEEATATAHMKRMRRRYSGRTPSILIKMEKKRRAGVYHFTWPGGERSIRSSGLASAKRILRTLLRTKRLPNGITWEFKG
jgi:hypothetical protein